MLFNDRFNKRYVNMLIRDILPKIFVKYDPETEQRMLCVNIPPFGKMMFGGTGWTKLKVAKFFQKYAKNEKQRYTEKSKTKRK